MSKVYCAYRCCFVIFAGLVCFSLYAAMPRTIRQLKHESWQMKGNHTFSSVYDILQTSDGLLWFTASAGAVRYNGSGFRTFSNATETAFKSSFAVSLAEYPEGTLWVGTGNGLLRMKGGDWTFFGKTSGLPGRVIMKLLVDSGHRLWAGTDHGLAFRDGEDDFHVFSRLQESMIRGLIEIAPKKIWVIAGTRLYAIAGDRIASVCRASETGEVLSVAPDHRGGGWISAEKGLFHFQNGQLYPVQLGLPSSGTKYILSTMLVARDGTLWCGVKGMGLGRLVSGQFQLFGEKDGLTQQDVLSLMEDREGSLWVGTGDGVDQFRAAPFSSYGEADGLPYRIVQSVCEDDTASMWVATQRGVVRFAPDGGIDSYLKGTSIYSLLPVGKGRVWAGGRDLHAVPSELPGEKQFFSRFKNMRIFSMASSSDGSRWLGTAQGLFRIAGGNIQALGKNDGLPSVRIRVIRNAPDGSLWVGTDNGICHVLVGDPLRVIPLKHRLNNSFVYELFIEKNGTLWAGTDSGLRRIRGNSVSALTVKNGLPANDVYAIQADDRDNFWISNGAGIFSVSKNVLEQAMDGKNEKIHPRIFDTRDGLPVNSGLGGTQPVSWKTVSGKMWFATTRGLTGVDPDHIPRNAVAPHVQIEEVRIDGRPFPLHDTLVLQPGWKRLKITYAGLSFVVPERNRYRTMLKGFETGFLEDSEQEKEYTNLDPGEYTFLVYAANNDGVWSTEPAVFSFTVLTPWWRTTWFLGLLLVFAGVLMNLLAKGLHRSWSMIKQWRSAHVFGKYRILNAVGRGGMGTVYRAVSKKGGETVALKVMDSDIADEDAQKRFLREGHVGQEMDHPNIVKIFDSGKESGRLYYVMEYCQGTCLHDLMEEGLSVRAVLSIGIVLCDALHYLHEKGVVHRDVKPENIMILSEPDFRLIDEVDDPVSLAGSCVKLLDLGLARLAGATTLTRTGLVAGTIMYVPPESLGGSKNAAPAVDFYAVGIMIYEMVTGIAPYTGEDMAELMYAVLYRTPATPKSVEPRVPEPVSDFIMRLIEKEAALRLSDYVEIRKGFMKLMELF